MPPRPGATQAAIFSVEKKFLACLESRSTLPVLKLVVVHYHFRPGGVRRVIELALPHFSGALPAPLTEVLLVAGEPPPPAWLAGLRAALGPLPVSVHIDPALAYVAERRRITPKARMHRLRRFFAQLFALLPPAQILVWAHNQSLGRNLALTGELTRAVVAHRARAVFHHHDWWFDNRWARWPEMRHTGGRTLAQVAATLLPTAPGCRHATINQADAAMLAAPFGRRAAWLPNLANAVSPPAAAEIRRARAWLTAQLGDDAPVWLVPCRLLRRKNLAEALLLTRWLRPEAWLVTTGGVSSAEEQPYAAALARAAHAAGWKCRLSVLDGDEEGKPAVPALLAASEVVLLTSLQEGFGLPYLEAAAMQRPLIARSLPNVAPDLAHFGFRFPQAYDEVLVAPTLFDWAAERKRQRELRRDWLGQLPLAVRRLAGQPAVLAAEVYAEREGRGEAVAPAPVPFSRLTLTAQLEVLRQPVAHSWALCAPLNPFLMRWRARAARGALGVTRWPATATAGLGGAAYAQRFAALLAAPESRSRGRGSSAVATAAAADSAAGRAAQAAFIAQKLRAENLYPLTWTP